MNFHEEMKKAKAGDPRAKKIFKPFYHSEKNRQMSVRGMTVQQFLDWIKWKYETVEITLVTLGNKTQKARIELGVGSDFHGLSIELFHALPEGIELRYSGWDYDNGRWLHDFEHEVREEIDYLYKKGLAKTTTQQTAPVVTTKPEIEDPTDKRMWKILQEDLSITDKALAQRMGNMGRQAANARRKGIEKMGYKVREPKQKKIKVSRQNKQVS